MTTTELPSRNSLSGDVPKPARRRDRFSARRVWLLSFAAFFLMATAWALALPVEGNTDEIAHTERAYAVATGQWLGPQSRAVFNRPGALFTVPKSLVPWNGECMFHPSVKASCERWSTSTQPVTANSWTGRYSPLYYLPVGLPMRWWPNEGGVIAGRVVSAALNAVLLATATMLAALVGSRLLLLAVLAAATPSALNLAGAVNPNGLEISAGILLWTCVVVMVLDGSQLARSAATWGTVAGFILLTTRALGPVWWAATLVLGALLADRARLRSLRALGGWRPRLAVLGVGAVGGLVWNLVSGNFEYYRTTTLADDRRHHIIGASLSENVSTIVTVRMDGWLRGVVGVAGQYDYFAPMWLVVVWFAVISTLIGLAMLFAPRRQRLVVAAIGATTLLLTVALELKYLHILGWTQVSRYFMPFAAGMWIVAAGVVPDTALPQEAERRFLRSGAAIMALGQITWLAMTMNRYQSGPFARLDPFTGAWTPSVGTVLPLATMAVGAACTVWLARTSHWSAANMPASMLSDTVVH